MALRPGLATGLPFSVMNSVVFIAFNQTLGLKMSAVKSVWGKIQQNLSRDWECQLFDCVHSNRKGIARPRAAAEVV